MENKKCMISTFQKYKITEILHESLCKNNSYNVIIKLNGHLITFGFMLLKPYEGDIIECDLVPRDDHTSYKFNTYKVYLPLGEMPQIQRINKILQNENYEYNYNVIKNYFSQFNYGENFWLNLFIRYNKDKNLSNIYEPLKIIGTHVIKYYNSLIGHFKQELEKNGIKLFTNQYKELYLHPNFGFNIKQWNPNDLFILFDIECFTIKSILNIAIGLKINQNLMCEIIILYCLTNSYNGSTCIKYSYYRLLDEIQNHKDLDFDFIQKILTLENWETIIDDLIEKNKLIKIHNYLYSTKLYEIEISIAQLLHRINKNKSIIECLDLDINIIDNYIQNYKVKSDMYLNSQQKKGIKEVSMSNVSIIYGKAGTGKSSLLGGLLNIIEFINNQFTEQQIQVLFLTPTAKAKMKLYEDILKDYINYKDNIKTINSFCYIELLDCYKKNNLFVIDETSMVDVNLMNKMLEIISNIENVSILFLGDIRQLPSIGPGDFLNNIIESKCFSSTELNIVVRNGGIITDVLDKITDGIMLNPSDYNNTPDFRWIIPCNKNYLNYIKKLIQSPDDMIIATTNKIINNLTNEIRKLKNPNESSFNNFDYIDKDYNKITLKVNDPVIFNQNFNQDGLFNGMTGTIIEIVNSYNITKMSNIIKIKVQFSNTFFIFDSDSEYIKYLKPAYMITVHKSQGQEYSNIIIILTDSELLNRNTLYTAISRAKKSVCILATEKILAKAIKRKNKRNSLLSFLFNYYQTKNIETFEIFMAKNI